ncbi:MAG TPA: GNAT family N-acetyltransferase [Solirubrobacteraceae bacterium]|nr:GNAT family N-acetyltransferase [Solirubrobacteraceae bacterium]
MTGLDGVETERMVAERLRPVHQDELARLLSDPRVARTLWPGEPPPGDAQLRYILSDKLDHWDRYGFGLWLLRDRATGAVVGRGGLQHTVIGRNGEVEAGWAIAPERWGEGLGTELARACVTVGFGTLELAEIIAMAVPSNVASRRVMEKASFAYERDVVHRGIDHVLYRARRPGLRAHRLPTPGDPKPPATAK